MKQGDILAVLILCIFGIMAGYFYGMQAYGLVMFIILGALVVTWAQTRGEKFIRVISDYL